MYLDVQIKANREMSYNDWNGIDAAVRVAASSSYITLVVTAVKTDEGKY